VGDGIQKEWEGESVFDRAQVSEHSYRKNRGNIKTSFILQTGQ